MKYHFPVDKLLPNISALSKLFKADVMVLFVLGIAFTLVSSYSVSAVIEKKHDQQRLADLEVITSNLLDYQKVNGRLPEACGDKDFVIKSTDSEKWNKCLNKVVPKGASFVDPVNDEQHYYQMSYVNGELKVTPANFERSSNAQLMIAGTDLIADALSSGSYLYTFFAPNEDMTPKLDGVVRSIVTDEANDRVYVAGEFNKMWAETSAGIVIDKTTGEVTSTFPVISYSGDVLATAGVHKAVNDGGGGWFVGGGFNIVGGQTINNLTHILADGTVDSSFVPNPNGAVYDLILSGNKLYVAGSFSAIGGVNRSQRSNLAVIDIDTGLVDDGFNAGAIDSFVNNILLSGNDLYIAGYYVGSVNGTTRNRFALLDATTGALKNLNLNIGGNNGHSISDMIIINNTLYISGSFDTVLGTGRKNVAAINLTNGTLTSFNPITSVDSTLVMAINDGVMYVGGGFVTINGVNRWHVAAFNLSDGSMTNFDLSTVTGTDLGSGQYSINSLDIDDNNLYVLGEFTYTINNVRRRGAVSINLTNNSVNDFGPLTLNSAANPWSSMSMGVGNSAFISAYVTGSTSYTLPMNGYYRRNYIAAFTKSTNMPVYSFNPNANDKIYSLALADDVLYAGGDFTQIGGASRNRLAALDLDTGVATSFNPDVNGTVRSLALNGSSLFVGGDFTTVGSVDARRMAALSVNDGSVLNDFNVNGSVKSMALQGSNLYFGGEFSSVGGVTRNNVAAVNKNTYALSSFNPNVNGGVNVVVANSESLYMGGGFTSVGSVAKTNLAAVDINTGAVDTDFSADTFYSADSTDGYVSALALNGNVLYVGGYFQFMSPGNDSFFGEINSGTGEDLIPSTGFSPSFDGSVTAISVSSDRLIVGGNFVRSDTQGVRSPYLTSFNAQTPTIGFATDYTTTRGGSFSLPVSINAMSSNIVTVRYEITGGTAVNGVDYNLPQTGTVTIPPYSTTTSIVVPILRSVSGGDKTIVFTLSNPSNCILDTVYQSTLSITSWAYVGQPGFMEVYGKLSFAFDNNDVPYVFSPDSVVRTGRVKKYNGTDWVAVGGGVTGYNDHGNLIFDSENNPYLLTTNGLFVDNVTLFKYNGSSWGSVGDLVGLTDNTGDAFGVMDASNTPYVVYKDNELNGKATVKKFDGTNWVSVGSAGFSSSTVANIFIAVDSNGTPYISYYEDYSVKVKKFDGTNWVAVGDAVTTDVLSHSFAIGGDNSLYIAYQSNENYSKVKKFDGISWVTLGPDSASFTPDGMQPAKPHIKVNNDDIPYIAYKNAGENNSVGKVSVVKFNGTTWEYVGNSYFSEGLAFSSYNSGDVTVLDFDSGGTPSVLFKDLNLDPDTHALSMMKYSSAPRITSYTGSFSQEASSYGLVSGSRVINLAGDSFVNPGGTLTEGVHYSVANVPEGLRPAVSVSASGKIATLTLSGRIFSNGNLDDVANLTITFLDGAFVDTPRAVDVINYSNNTGTLTFFDDEYGNWDLIGSTANAYTNTGGGDVRTAFAIDNENIPYLAFIDEQNNRKATVMKFTNETGEIVGNAGFSNSIPDSMELAFNASNTPYVLYNDAGLGGKMSVKKFNGTDWEVVGSAGFSEAGPQYPSIDFDADNVPYVSYKLGTGVGTAVLILKKFNGSNWVSVGDQVPLSGNGTHFSFDLSNVPYVIFSDATNGSRATVMKFNGATWERVGNAGFSSSSLSYPYLNFDSNNVPYVVFSDGGYSQRTTVMKFNGAAWELVGNDGFSSGNLAIAPSIDFDSHNVPFVFFMDNQNVNHGSVMKFNGTDWVIVGVPAFTPMYIAMISSVQIDSNDNAYVAYSSNYNSNPIKAAIMKYSKAPNKITTFSVVAEDAQAVLSWTAPAESGSPTIDYLVEYKKANESYWTTFAHAASVSTTITVTGLTNDTAYDFRVSAVDAFGAGEPATKVTVTPSRFTLVYSSPTSVIGRGSWVTTDVMTVRLSMRPRASVYVRPMLSAPVATLSEDVLIFTPDNWNTTQSLTIDPINSSTQASAVMSFEVLSADAYYNNISPSSILISVRENLPTSGGSSGCSGLCGGTSTANSSNINVNNTVKTDSVIKAPITSNDDSSKKTIVNGTINNANNLLISVNDGKVIVPVIVSEQEKYEIKQRSDAPLKIHNIDSSKVYKSASEEAKQVVKAFVAFGTEKTNDLNNWDRAKVLSSFQSAFNKLPSTAKDLSDLDRIASGQKPEQINKTAEANAIKVFKQVFKVAPNLKSEADKKVFNAIAYGAVDYSEKRDLKAEQQALKIYVKAFKKLPKTSSDWQTLKAVSLKVKK